MFPSGRVAPQYRPPPNYVPNPKIPRFSTVWPTPPTFNPTPPNSASPTPPAAIFGIEEPRFVKAVEPYMIEGISVGSDKVYIVSAVHFHVS